MKKIILLITMLLLSITTSNALSSEIEGNLTVYERLGIGATPSLANSIQTYNIHSSDSSPTQISTMLLANPSSLSAYRTYHAIQTNLTWSGTKGSYDVDARGAFIRSFATSNLTNLWGIYTQSKAEKTTNINGSYGLVAIQARPYAASLNGTTVSKMTGIFIDPYVYGAGDSIGTISNYYGIWQQAVYSGSANALITNAYGLYFNSYFPYTSNNEKRIGIYIAAMPYSGSYTGTTTAAIQIAGTGQRNQILFGTDTNLYGNGTSILKTDGSLNVTGDIYYGGTLTQYSPMIVESADNGKSVICLKADDNNFVGMYIHKTDRGYEFAIDPAACQAKLGKIAVRRTCIEQGKVWDYEDNKCVEKVEITEDAPYYEESVIS